MDLANSYSGPNSLHSAMEWYGTIGKDGADNLPILQRKLKMPLHTVAGEHCLGPAMVDVTQEFADDVRGHVIKNCGRRIREKDPDALVDVLRLFLEP